VRSILTPNYGPVPALPTANFSWLEEPDKVAAVTATVFMGALEGEMGEGQIDPDDEVVWETAETGKTKGKEKRSYRHHPLAKTQCTKVYE
jgi:hypothetical protein